MSMSPEQMRKKSLAMADADRHARYNQAAYERDKSNTSPEQSRAIEAAGSRVKAATAKEEASIGPADRSPNNNVRF